MANEAVKVLEYSLPINFTCADGVGIEQGALLKLTDGMTAVKSDGDDDIIAGICHTEKIANDGTTSVSVYIDGIFRMTSNGTIATGNMVKSNAGTTENTVIAIAAAAGATENIGGKALQDATDGDAFLFELNPSQMSWPA